jgi:hypothetical protein
MKKERAPEIKDFTGRNIISNLMYFKEALKREKDPEKAKLLQKRFNELKFELNIYKAA